MDESNRRIVIRGKTGTGKSSLANTIFGENLFKINHTLNSETSECRGETKHVNGRNITLIDTPGFFDTDRSEKELKSEIVKCITEFAPGPHAFLIVLKVEKFTNHEQAVITKINQLFSEEAFKYATVLFTHGQQLPEEQTIEDFVRDNKLVSDLVKNLAGITTGALLGALFGGVLMGEDVFKVLKKVLLELEQCDRVLPKISKTAGRIAAGAGIAGTAGIAVGTLVGAVTVGGAIKGGFRGYDAAEGADTPRKAVKRAAKAVMDDALSVFIPHDKKAKNKSESEASLSPQSSDLKMEEIIYH